MSTGGGLDAIRLNELTYACAAAFSSALARTEATNARCSAMSGMARLACMGKGQDATGVRADEVFQGMCYNDGQGSAWAVSAADPLYDVHSESGVRMVVSHLHGLTRLYPQLTVQRPSCPKEGPKVENTNSQDSPGKSKTGKPRESPDAAPRCAGFHAAQQAAAVWPVR